MPDSVYDLKSGECIPLGFIAVQTPGTPVRFTVNVDPNNYDAPGTAINLAGRAGQRGTPTCSQIILQGAAKDQNSHYTPNTGYIFILKRAVGGAGNKDDFGCIVGIIFPGGQGYNLPSNPVLESSLSPYAYYLDATVVGEGAIGCAWGVR